MNALVFFSGENMGADGQVVVVAVDELERQQEVLSFSTRRAGAENAISYADRSVFAVTLPVCREVPGRVKKNSPVFLCAPCG
jgi:hypothetical protein